MNGTRMERRRAKAGFLFILPWFIGTALFFVQPLVQLIRFAFARLTLVEGAGMALEPLPEGIWENFTYALFRDSTFPRLFFQSVTEMLYRLPVILAFAMFVAILLNQSFHGRGFMRAVFFLPVVITSGVIVSIIRTSLTNVTLGADGSSSIFSAATLVTMLLKTGLPEQLVYTVGGMVTNVTDLVWGSGVQILIFLMGILTIPDSYYEVAKIEGATGWETFWKVVFPAVSPYILVNLVYTTIDSFINYDNAVMQYITKLAYKNVKFSQGAAMAWCYFLVILLCVALMFLLMHLAAGRGAESRSVSRRRGRRH